MKTTKTKTTNKIKNVLLTILGLPMAILMFSEVQDQQYWWTQFAAALGVLIVIKIALGGKNERHQSWGD